MMLLSLIPVKNSHSMIAEKTSDLLLLDNPYERDNELLRFISHGIN